MWSNKKYVRLAIADDLDVKGWTEEELIEAFRQMDKEKGLV